MPPNRAAADGLSLRRAGSRDRRRALLALVVGMLPLTVGGGAAADTVIGLAAPATGRQAETGRLLTAAAERTIAALNAEGGVLGEPLRLVTADDQCSDAGGAGAAQTLLAAGARLVVGHPCEKAALAGAIVYGPANALFIASQCRHPALTDRRAGAGIFRLSGREDGQGAAAAAWLSMAAPSARIAIVQDRTAYARSLTSATTLGLAALSPAPPLVLPIVAGEKSYAKVIDAIAAAKSEAVLFAGYPAEALIILRGLRAAGLTSRFLGSDALAAPDFAETSLARDPGVALLMRSDAGAAAGIEAAIRLWAKAAEKAQTFDTAAVAAVLHGGALEAKPLGSITFDEKGDARVPSFVPGSWNGERWASRN